MMIAVAIALTGSSVAVLMFGAFVAREAYRRGWGWVDTIFATLVGLLAIALTVSMFMLWSLA